MAGTFLNIWWSLTMKNFSVLARAERNSRMAGTFLNIWGSITMKNCSLLARAERNGRMAGTFLNIWGSITMKNWSHLSSADSLYKQFGPCSGWQKEGESITMKNCRNKSIFTLTLLMVTLVVCDYLSFWTQTRVVRIYPSWSESKLFDTDSFLERIFWQKTANENKAWKIAHPY